MNKKTQPLPYIIFIDSCAFWPPQQEEKLAMEQLWVLDRKGVISLDVCEATDEEMQQAPLFVKDRLREKVNSRIFASEVIGNQKEREIMLGIKVLLFPGRDKLEVGEERDVRNLFCAQKYGNIFVTVDKKDILNKASLIKEQLRFDVFLPSKCLKVILDWLEWDKKHEEEIKRLRGDLQN